MLDEEGARAGAHAHGGRLPKPGTAQERLNGGGARRGAEDEQKQGLLGGGTEGDVQEEQLHEAKAKAKAGRWTKATLPSLSVMD